MYDELMDQMAASIRQLDARLRDIGRHEHRPTPPWVVVDHPGDGVRDATEAIMLAHDKLPSTGGLILLPTGIFPVSASGSNSALEFTKSVMLWGMGQGATTIEKVGEGTSQHIINSTGNLDVANFTVRHATAPGYTGTAAVRMVLDGTGLTGRTFRAWRLTIRNANYGILLSGDSAADPRRITDSSIRECNIMVAGSATPATQPSECIAVQRVGRSLIEFCTLDNNNTGDHNLYNIGNAYDMIRNCLFKNVAYDVGAAIKMLSESGGQPLEAWHVENNEGENQGYFMTLVPSASIGLIRVAGNRFKQATSANAALDAAVRITTDGPIVISKVDVVGNTFANMQLAALLVYAAATGVLEQANVTDNKFKDFSLDASGVHPAIRVGSGGGTKKLLIAHGNLAIGGGTGKQLFDDTVSFDTLKAWGNHELDCTNTNLRETDARISTLVEPPAATTTVVAGTTIAIAGTHQVLTSAANVTVTATPTIADGSPGQLVELLNAGGFNITLQDQGTLAGSNLRLETATIVLTPRASVLLRYSPNIGDWVQVGKLVIPI